MHGIESYVAVVAIVFGVNLLPAFGPATWMLLVLFKLNWDLNPVALVVLGALAAGAGRYVLARVTHRLRAHLSPKRRANLEAGRAYLQGHRAGSVLGIALFALSPLPSAQLFEAAGVLGLPLLPLTVAFFAGRLVSYSLYVTAATIAEQTYGDAIRSSITSPVGIALQILMLLGVAALTRVDWQRLLDRRQAAADSRRRRAS